jgi:hypothetical protein
MAGPPGFGEQGPSTFVRLGDGRFRPIGSWYRMSPATYGPNDHPAGWERSSMIIRIARSARQLALGAAPLAILAFVSAAGIRWA